MVVYGVLAWAMAGASSAHAQDTVAITTYVGASIQLEYDGLVIHIDPWGVADYSEAPLADIILVTDTPADHLDPELISNLRHEGTLVILPSTPDEARDEEGRERLLQVFDGYVVSNGERVQYGTLTIEAIPAYDLIPGDPFHNRGQGNGYLLDLGSTRVYVAGVTECVPEIQALRDIDIAFLPINLPNGRMTPAAAAACVKAFLPRVVYPYHDREIPIDGFAEALADSPVEVRVVDWYARP